MISGKLGPIIRAGLFSDLVLVNYLSMTDNYDAPSVLFTNVKVLSNDLNVYEEGIYAATFTTTDASGNISAPFLLYIDINRKYARVTSTVQDVVNDQLMTIYPNPSNGIFNVTTNLPTNEQTTLAVYDVMGSKIADISTAVMQQGTYSVDNR